MTLEPLSQDEQIRLAIYQDLTMMDKWDLRTWEMALLYWGGTFLIGLAAIHFYFKLQKHGHVEFVTDQGAVKKSVATPKENKREKLADWIDDRD